MTEKEFLSLKVGDKVAYLSKGKTFELEGRIDRIIKDNECYGIVVVNPVKFTGDKTIVEENNKDLYINGQMFRIERLVREDHGEPIKATYVWSYHRWHDLPLPSEKPVSAEDKIKKGKGQQLFDTSEDDERLDNEEKTDSSECCALARVRVVDNKGYNYTQGYTYGKSLFTHW